jgi:peroxiredoxin
MKILLLAGALCAFFTATLSAADASLLDKDGNPAGFRTLAIGDAAPDFTLPGIDGRNWSLKDFARHDFLIVLFTSNHCPTSHGIEGRLKKLRADLKGKNVGLVAINPNHPDGLRLDELGFGEFGDSFEEMKPYAEQQGWDFPYLYDGDKQLTARAYGCLATPHVFIFDQERRLRYAGRFDDSRYADESTVKSPDARNAIEALLAGRPVPTALTKPHGCSTKWREKKAGNVAAEAAWKNLPVTIAPIDAKGVAELRANPTNKYRLFNVWATWCAPCVEEFPLLVSIARQFDMRDFELITLTVDEPKQQTKAQAFLERMHAGLSRGGKRLLEREGKGRTTNHYLFTEASTDVLFAALDDQAPGPIPHTVLVAPGGEIVWRHNGVIDRAATVAALADAMTRYYQPEPAAK